MKLRLIAPLCLTALLCSCNDGATPCARVTCDQGYTCNAKTGVCEHGDAGVTDGGNPDGGSGCTPACPAGLLCEPTTLACVSCLSDSDCGCPKPVCGPANLCIGGTPDGGAT